MTKLHVAILRFFEFPRGAFLLFALGTVAVFYIRRSLAASSKSSERDHQKKTSAPLFSAFTKQLFFRSIRETEAVESTEEGPENSRTDPNMIPGHSLLDANSKQQLVNDKMISPLRPVGCKKSDRLAKFFKNKKFHRRPMSQQPQPIHVSDDSTFIHP